MYLATPSAWLVLSLRSDAKRRNLASITDRSGTLPVPGVYSEKQIKQSSMKTQRNSKKTLNSELLPTWANKCKMKGNKRKRH
jgi:hypothetical protein